MNQNESENTVLILVLSSAILMAILLLVSVCLEVDRNMTTSSTVEESVVEPYIPVESELLHFVKEEQTVTLSLEELNKLIEDKIRKEIEQIYEERKETEKVDAPAETPMPPVMVGDEVYVTDLPSGIFYCTDYRFYGLPNTPHWRMQQRAWTDENGCRRFNDDYIVALGSGYTVDLGERYGVLLDNGTYFTIIMGDAKADCDTDWATHTYMPCYDYDGRLSANVLEFIIDDEVMDPRAYSWGGVHYYPQFRGNIIKMTYLGRDQSGDWDSYV